MFGLTETNSHLQSQTWEGASEGNLSSGPAFVSEPRAHAEPAQTREMGFI